MAGPSGNSVIMVTHDVKILPRLLRIGEVPAESIADALTSRSGGPSEDHPPQRRGSSQLGKRLPCHNFGVASLSAPNGS
ncbi:MAG: hypothetical protein K9J75_10150 [Cyanobium usitatum Tobar12.5m-G36]|nr:hypothetical protein [Cyanobium usitatum Tobar12.5m-G36]